MKKLLRNEEPEAPRPVMVAVVSSLTPEFCLYNTATGSLRRVIGGNVLENSVYLEGKQGDMPKAFRMAAEDGSYENELIFQPLTDTIEEVPLDEYPEYKLVLTDCKVIEINRKPEPERCKVIEHPAVKFNPVKSKAKQPKDIAPGTLHIFPFAEPDYSPVTQISA